jgi:CDP-6-deoxy-D-xylo-4-hexulose-3-dehydrase
VSRLEAALTPRTRMVMAVNILGNPAALDVMRSFCDSHDLVLFEDNCESLGATLGNRQCGTFGEIGTFSSFFSHHISTMEGGLLVTDDLEIYHLARSLRAHGWTRDVPADSPIYSPKTDDFFEAYRFILPGYNVRPLEMSGAIGIEQLKKLDGMIEVRRRNAALFMSLFKGDERFIIQRENGRSSWFSFTFVLNPKLALKRERYDYDCVGQIVNAELAHTRGFFVGNHPADIAPQLHRLREVLDAAAR